MIRHASAISLPNIRLDFSQKTFREEYLLVAGGREPAASWLHEAAKERVLFGIDKGADACRAAGALPSLYIGDSDSVNPDTLEWINNAHVETKRFPTEKDKECSSAFHTSIIFSLPCRNCPSAGPYHKASSSMASKNGI